jgi:membrane protein
VYYSAQILLFGAEFTQVYANTLGSRIVPSDNAVVADPAKAQESWGQRQRGPTQAADKGHAPVSAAMAVRRASTPAVQHDATTGEQPPWWFGLVVLGVSLTRFSRRWAK